MFLNLQFCLYQYVKDRFLTNLILYKVEIGEKLGLEPCVYACLATFIVSLFCKTVRQEAWVRKANHLYDFCSFLKGVLFLLDLAYARSSCVKNAS